ncbi:MAG TPA: Rid family detoxifying hydrolase [Streptomyces sp.]
METQVFTTENAPTPVGPYSQAVRRGNIISVSGQVGLDPATNKLVEGGIAEQTRQTLTNLEAALKNAGASFDDVVTVRIYITQATDFAPMNEVYSKFLSEPFPCRTTVFVGLPSGMLVEIDVLAVVD